MSAEYELKAPAVSVTTDDVETSSNDNSLDEKKNSVAQHLHEFDVIADRMREAGDMDDILATGGAGFFVEKLHTLSVDEAREILQYALDYHNTDINFPATTLSRIQKLLQGEEAYGQGPVFYDLDLRLEASLMKYHSPYPEVRSVCSPTDDPTIPVETFRAYAIGIFWVAVAGFVNQILYYRQPHFSLTSQVLQLLLVPFGQFAAKFVPAWKIRVWKWTVNLNPGPWTFKEQMFATIITNVGAQNAVWGQYAPVLRENIFYGQEWANYGFTVLINIICQLFGLGMAGVLRRWCVYPSKAVWPTLLPTLQLNRTLLVPEDKKSINGWRISKYRLFNILLAAAFVYFFIPDYLFTALSTFNWMTWIAPKNKNLAFVTGSTIGTGFNPWTTFDWSVINYSSPLVVPFFTIANQYAGTVVGAVVLLILYYTNFKYTAYVPPNTSTVYDRFGLSYNLTRVLDNGVLDVAKYKAYSPPYVSAGYYMYLCASYVIYMLAFVYIFLMEWRTFKDAITGFFRGLKNRKLSTYEQYRDPLSVLMRQYKEVPDWWFLVILAISFVVACVVMAAYPTTTPVSSVVVIFLVSVAMLIPCMVLYASTGYFMSTNMLGTIIAGYLVPGNGIACLFIRAMGFCVEDQSETYVSDQKLAHYSKLPPRAVFRGQLIGTVVQIFVTAGAMEVVHGMQDFCSWTQSARFTCAWSHSIYSGTLLFGVIGPNRTFNTLYPMIKWSFLIGACIAIPLYFVRQKFPKYLRSFQPVLFLGGITRFGSNYNLSYYTPGFYFSFFFMYYVRTRYLAWWSKYNYIITSGLSAGIAFSGILIFLALQYHPKTLTWWGTTVQSAGIDGKGVAALKSIPAVGYFGIPPGTWQ
ncbi:OPT oligopeptide transporter protein-domain-containing protein [Lipomyces kononenkoae]|uniref:OPT oligopeptide transporter protein-domain-containing protein n=1 Tax=Lipomyces kononenkoae TaxID=34357 RepID=A0ACC3T4C7_LIPKO